MQVFVCTIALWSLCHFSLITSTACLLAHLLSLTLQLILLMKYSFGVGEDVHGLWSKLTGLQEPMEDQVFSVSKLATNEANIDPKQRISWESEQKTPDIHCLWNPQCKNVLLGGIKLYLKLETRFVVDCTLLSLNAGVVNASSYNLRCGLYHNLVFKWTVHTHTQKKVCIVLLHGWERKCVSINAEILSQLFNIDPLQLCPFQQEDSIGKNILENLMHK